MDTADNECPRLTHMVPGGRKELVKKPALPFGKSFPFLPVLFSAVFPFASVAFSSSDGWCLRASALTCCYRWCAVSPCGFRLTPPGVGGNVVLFVSDACIYSCGALSC
jgi:hypothetical protein